MCSMKNILCKYKQYILIYKIYFAEPVGLEPLLLRDSQICCHYTTDPICISPKIRTLTLGFGDQRATINTRDTYVPLPGLKPKSQV